MPPVGFEPTISAGDRPQTYSLNPAATGTGSQLYSLEKIRYSTIQLLQKVFTTVISRYVPRVIIIYFPFIFL